MNLFEYLNSKNIKFWTVREINVTRDELYKIKDDVESIRRVVNSYYIISVYVDHNSYTGSSSILLPSDLNKSSIFFQIDRAIAQASLVKNKYYPIEQGAISYDIINRSIDKNSLYELMEIKPKNVILSSSEYFIENTNIKFTNSAGNKYEYNTSKIQVETVMLSKDKEIETYSLREANSLETLDLTSIINEQERFTLDLRRAKPTSDGNFKVVFSSDVLEEFFSFFLFHSLGSSFYDKYSIFKLSEKVTNMDLTIKSVPLIMRTEPADNLGFAYKPFTILENGVLKNIVASAKYSHYLNVPFTGEASNIVIEPGFYKYDDLLDEGTMIIEKVSCFAPKEITGDFSAEIRLGYIIKNGEKVPIKGGCFTGNLKDFNKIYLTNDTSHYNSYVGPKAFALEGVLVKG